MSEKIWTAEGASHRSVAGVELVEEALVPRIDAVVENALNHGQQALGALALGGQDEVELGDEVGGRGGLDEDAAAALGDGARGLFGGGLVGGADKGDDELLDGVKELIGKDG